MIVQYDPTTRQIVAYGHFDSAPDGYSLAEVADDETPFRQAGMKLLAQDGTVRVVPLPVAPALPVLPDPVATDVATLKTQVAALTAALGKLGVRLP